VGGAVRADPVPRPRALGLERRLAAEAGRRARVAGANVGWAAAALDGRWAAIRIPALSQLVGFALLLGGIVRARGDLHSGRAATWIYIAFVSAVLLLLGWLLATMPPERDAPPLLQADA
jgi:uncharacterized membrane protein HdeD (DUF308 family)